MLPSGWTCLNALESLLVDRPGVLLDLCSIYCLLFQATPHSLRGTHVRLIFHSVNPLCWISLFVASIIWESTYAGERHGYGISPSTSSTRPPSSPSFASSKLPLSNLTPFRYIIKQSSESFPTYIIPKTWPKLIPSFALSGKRWLKRTLFTSFHNLPAWRRRPAIILPECYHTEYWSWILS